MLKIILLGYMGSGKSTIGKLLASDIGIPFRDLDTVIETSLNTSIPSIFEEKGEIFFRKKEAEILNDLLQTPREMVLATGGGTPCYGDNLRWMLSNGSHVVYLQYSVPELEKRLKLQREERPLISHISDHDLGEFIGKHLLERAPFYTQATIVIKADGKSPEELVGEIKEVLS